MTSPATSSNQTELLERFLNSFSEIDRAVLLLMVGLNGPRHQIGQSVVLAICLAIGAAVYVYIWWLNQQARKNHLEPLLEYYVAMQETIDHGDDFEIQFLDPPSAFLKPTSPTQSDDDSSESKATE